MIYSLFLILVLLLGCSPTESEEPEYGCTIQSASNFESDATTYDASCLWPLNAGCSCSDVENEVAEHAGQGDDCEEKHVAKSALPPRQIV